MVNKAELIEKLAKNKMTEIIELMDDAENGELEELELARSLGLLRDEELNEQVIHWLTENGVKIIYLDDEE
ncbi:hypothetical protein SAMN05421736_104100 [Evansella caseinilytica]|uniref:Uncharacterized protein n=1 Tax=Evansella caseinilytica TaxID=1503961 RepID=A0A1H3NLF4_9BACI|nr:hypothetical protein SAMN05421736_104100 [Evansella caseinilytica]